MSPEHDTQPGQANVQREQAGDFSEKQKCGIFLIAKVRSPIWIRSLGIREMPHFLDVFWVLAEAWARHLSFVISHFSFSLSTKCPWNRVPLEPRPGGMREAFKLNL